LGIPLPFTGEFEVVIMIEVVTEEMHGSDWDSWPETITSEPWLVWHLFPRERNGALLRVHAGVRSKMLDRGWHC